MTPDHRDGTPPRQTPAASDRFLMLSNQTLRRLNRRRFVGGAAALGAALVVGSHATRLASAQETESILIGTLGEATSINPFAASESEGLWRCKMLFDEFVRANVEDYSPQPGLAAEWTNEELTYTFTLQPNAKFADGSDVTAEDVAFTIRGHLTKATASPWSSKYLGIEGAQAFFDGTAQDVTGIQVIDPKTLRITLAGPEAPFLYNLRYIFVVPAAQLQGKNLTNDPWFQKPVGAGPYVFESWTRDQDFVATANPNYWQQGKPEIPRLTHRVIADSQSLVLALQGAEIDASNYPNPAAKEQLEQVEGLTVMAPPFGSPNGWMFNCTHEQLAKPEVRRAIAMALDTEQFAATSLLGLGGAGLGPISPESWAFDPTLEPIPFDPAAAREMIAAAGAEGTQLRFNVNQGNIFREDWLTYTQQALQEIGIEVVPELIEYTALVEQVEGGDYDVTGVDFVGVTAEPSELAEQFGTGASGNYMGYSNPELDELLRQARQTLDIEAAKPIYAQIQRIIMADVPMHFAWYRPFLHAVSDRFTGYTDSAAYGLFHTLEDWSGPSA
ncbi:MAG: ABC transporter substrate-binding protein [Chloroflexota bacterium]|nr:ABC transporter substrate-binding protein [Chloroflexota bacterium]